MAQEDLAGFFARNRTSPQDQDYRAVVHSIPRLILGDVRPAIIAFSAAALLLLLITCFNVANLLLVRGMVRSREVAVRAALGAPRYRIVLSLLAENTVLALAGGVLGLLIALAAVQGFVALAPSGIPRLDQIGLDLAALGGAVAITAVALLLFGTAPALTAARIDVTEVVRAGGNTGAKRSRRGVELLVAGQIALAMLILSAAGLIARSLLELQRAELVLEPSRLLVGELAIPPEQFDSRDEQLALLDRIMAEIRATPGVVAVSPMVALPFAGAAGWDGRFASAGQSAENASKNPVLNTDVVVPEYFSAVGIQIVRGRGFTEADREGAPSVIVISETAARHYWPGADPIGQRLAWDGIKGPFYTVVGVVPDTRYRDLRTARPSIYFPLRQSIFFPFAPTTLAIRTQSSPDALVPLIRQAIQAASPTVELVEAATFASHREGPLAQPRLNAILLAGFATAALVLAAVGLFGVISTMVRQRTRELGIRLALGATESGLSRMVIGRGLALTLGGLTAGLAASLFANRLLQSLLYQVHPTDGVTLGLVALVLVSVALLACLVPARTVTRIEPTIALRDS
jgi:putative ABC transport system permease protein